MVGCWGDTWNETHVYTGSTRSVVLVVALRCVGSATIKKKWDVCPRLTYATRYNSGEQLASCGTAVFILQYTKQNTFNHHSLLWYNTIQKGWPRPALRVAAGDRGTRWRTLHCCISSGGTGRKGSERRCTGVMDVDRRTTRWIVFKNIIF